MNFIAGYLCSDCNTFYAGQEPSHCPNCVAKSTGFKAGDRVGPFRLLNFVNGSGWNVQCLLCNNVHVRRELRRVNSCGCLKGSSLKVVEFKDKSVLARCCKCGLQKEYEYPVKGCVLCG